MRLDHFGWNDLLDGPTEPRAVTHVVLLNARKCSGYEFHNWHRHLHPIVLCTTGDVQPMTREEVLLSIEWMVVYQPLLSECLLNYDDRLGNISAIAIVGLEVPAIM